MKHRTFRSRGYLLQLYGIIIKIAPLPFLEKQVQIKELKALASAKHFCRAANSLCQCNVYKEVSSLQNVANY